ncbi:SurA N-terminal domain-containing protein [Coxiella-like endosymbiont]|uniref:SurA N-terminal domain-containing protein n=1 Tax=Coxiella-like endosymbiont TaxID=1592897 RepID=UPI002868E7A4|nr:SurA N-terminal domain-containing protein [Coxiella-like endosymbiont]
MFKIIIHLMVISLITISTISMAQQSALSKLNAIQEEPLDQIAAVVNNDIITQNEFNHALFEIKKQLNQYHIPILNKKIFRKHVMEQLIYEKLQLQFSKRNQIKASDEEINAIIAKITEQNQLSQSDFKEKLTQQGISYREFRNQIRKQLLISKLQQQVIGNNITISKLDLLAFQKQHPAKVASTRYHVATILIRVPEIATQAQINHAREKAFLILKQLRKGLDFKCAMSAHPGSSDLGWRSTNNIPQIFLNSISKIKPNEVVGPIQAPNGFHLVKLLDKENLDITNNLQIQQVVYQKKFAKALQQWLGQLRRSSYVHIYMNF